MSSSPEQQLTPIERYYRFHAKIYDATRWSFLFGRKAIIQKVSTIRKPDHILEVGCGTGKNLISLCEFFPQANITALDLSEAMLHMARKKLGHLNERITLLTKAYKQPLQPDQPFDLIVFSYSLSMINPGWDQAIESAHRDLANRGMIAVVDFHDSIFPFFKWWMQLNHVRMDGHILPKLRSCFHPQVVEIRSAYAGLWKYVLFLGER